VKGSTKIDSNFKRTLRSMSATGVCEFQLRQKEKKGGKKDWIRHGTRGVSSEIGHDSTEEKALL